jgi:hypothetical protein
MSHHSAGIEPRLHIDDPRDDRRLRMMCPSGISESVGDDPKSFDLPDLVLDPHAKPAQPLVVFLFLVVQFAIFRLLVRIIDCFMFLVVALTGAVPISPRASGQLRPLAPDGQVVIAAGVGRRHARDAALFRYDQLGFQRVALLLAGVMLLLNLVVAGALDGLFRAIDDERLGFAPADTRLALHAEQWLREQFEPLDRSADRALIHMIEEADELLDDVAPVTISVISRWSSNPPVSQGRPDLVFWP